MSSVIRIVDAGRPDAVIPSAIINTYSALSVPAYKRAINFIADNLASFPRSVRIAGAKPDKKHPLDVILNRRPNGYQNPFTFWRTLYYHAAHTGNGYARINRGQVSDAPQSLDNLLPEDVQPFRLDRGEGLEQWYFHTLTDTAIPGENVIHIQQLSHDGMIGMDPVCLHSRTLQHAVTLQRFQVKFLKNGTIVRGAVEVPGTLTDDQMKQFRARLRQFRGVDAEDDILILTDSAKLSNETTTPQDSQLIEQTALTTKQIAQMTGVPPEFLFEMNEAKYNAGIEQAGQNVVRYCLRPWIEQSDDELTSKLLSTTDQDAGYTVRSNPDALLRGDTETQVDTIVATTKAGLRTQNEGRQLLELPPIDDPQANILKTSGDTTPKKEMPK